MDLADSEISARLCQASSGKSRHVHKFLRRWTLPEPEQHSPPFPLGSALQAMGHHFVLSKLQYLHRVCVSDLPGVQLLILILKFLSARLQSKCQGTEMNK